NYINQYASKLIGIEAKDALGKHLNEAVKIVDMRSGKIVKIPFESALRSGKPLLNRNHSVLISAANKETHVSFDISPFKDGKAKKTGVLFVIRDNSASSRIQEKSEQKLKKTQEELEQFIYIASHDLQEPLRMVQSYVQLLEKRYKSKLDSDADEFISYAVNGVSKMKNILADLLAYSRLNTKKDEFTETDCNELVKGIADNFNAKAETKAEFKIGALPAIRCDANQLFQLFYQLIDNAVKFSGAGSRVVKINGERNEDSWHFSVEDNGIGIDMKYSEKIFSMFQRLHNNEYPGTGIGLAMCRKIAENHGGEIRLESETGKGSIFHFTIAAGRESEI
ncbi:MAG: ATP-binding protein, partial [Ignavibacteria bacterium]